MAHILIAYYSRTGNTEKMAGIISDALKEEGDEVDLKKVHEVSVDSMLEYDGIIIGSPVYYGALAADIKKLFDDSVKIHGQLQGKAGGAFSSSANIGGGNETAITSILNSLLIHGMVIQGDPQGDHYGPVSINNPDSRATENCQRYGKRFSVLANKLT